MTLSARASSAGDTMRPSAFAVFRLIPSSYLFGACRGRSRCPLWVKSRHVQRTSRCPLSANSGHPDVLFDNLVAPSDSPFHAVWPCGTAGNAQRLIWAAGVFRTVWSAATLSAQKAEEGLFACSSAKVRSSATQLFKRTAPDQHRRPRSGKLEVAAVSTASAAVT